ncbi:hypothetical protein BO70DRAFT_398631 [Aspergillus heteromorphus CBS 117.55]|uniref:Uncharacterized protein n=1 Tax=Aspergillus heteromorphus CBS 117.55 TaxID=1448321 RepID=A0A317VN77_9EURO|nr:uncharacterized protein BO70DRAFT_398631 [Aspergillus heteromorphus CBS 117.55]PWY74302.1 hypothetical protein BO70DRAFT_398631 [Aspergillus heteromorphus CBS 117.55]
MVSKDDPELLQSDTILQSPKHSSVHKEEAWETETEQDPATTNGAGGKDKRLGPLLSLAKDSIDPSKQSTWAATWLAPPPVIRRTTVPDHVPLTGASTQFRHQPEIRPMKLTIRGDPTVDVAKAERVDPENDCLAHAGSPAGLQINPELLPCAPELNLISLPPAN